MSYLLNIAQHLQDSDVGYYTGAGKDIFVYQMPDRADSGILLKDAPLGTPIDHELPGYFSTEFYAIVRATEHAKGEAVANAMSTALTINESGVYGGLTVNFIRPRIVPMVFPVSEGDYIELLVIYDINFCI